MAEIAHLQQRAWIIVYAATGEPAHDEFFETREAAEQYLEQLTRDMERTPPPHLSPPLRLVSPEGEADLARRIRAWAEQITSQLKIIEAYL